MSADRVPEAVLSRIWNEGWHSRELRTTDGRRVGVVYRGVWSHSNGPDFRDAMLEIDGRLVHGAVELHVRSSDWQRHGHQFDPTYDAVVLHVVLEDDAADAPTGPGGAAIATVLFGAYLHGTVEQFMERSMPAMLGTLGSQTCLPTVAGERPKLVHAVLREAGWKRLYEKQLRLQQEMVARPPGEVLYRSLLDSLGLSANRAGMAAVADALPLVTAEWVAAAYGRRGILAALLGVAGFLPLSPGHQSLLSDQAPESLALEPAWATLCRHYGLSAEPPIRWNLNRVRPLNHPVRRLASLAALLDNAAELGLHVTVMSLSMDAGKGWDAWLKSADPPIGESRRGQIMVNSFAPFVAAYADLTGDHELSERIGAIWESLPGKVDDDIARKTLRQIVGQRRFPVRTAVEVQGLHQIGRHGCAHLRCFECPIAALAVRFETPAFSG